MWLVYDSEDRVIAVTDNYEEAEAIYLNSRDLWKNCINSNDEFYGDERVILAKIERDFHSYETDKESPAGDNYWDWKENVF